MASMIKFLSYLTSFYSLILPSFITMLTDHENLLSTFGKDSESSNRKSRDA